jgi:hypothetical protein
MTGQRMRDAGGHGGPDEGRPAGPRGAAGIRPLAGGDRGQALPIVLSLIAILFLVGSAMATHASVAIQSTAANRAQSADFFAADAGAELGIWWQRNGRPGNPPAISMNGKTVTTSVAVAGGGGACGTPTPTLVTGFEHGATSTAGGGLFSFVSGNGVSADAGVVRTGAYSLRVDNPNNSNRNAVIVLSGATAVVRLYVRLDALPAADVSELLSLVPAAGDHLHLGYDAAGQHLTLALGANPPVSSASTIAAGTWVRVDLRFSAGTNPRTAAWQVDGVDQSATSAAVAVSTVTGLRLGSTNGPDTFVANYDDIVVSASTGDYPIGPGGVIGLQPDGMGASNTPTSFRHEDGSAIDASTYLRLDESPMTSTADYVKQVTAGATSYVAPTFADTTATCIQGVSGVLAYHSASSSTNNGKTSVFDGATERVIYSGDMSEAGLAYRSAIVPRAGGWTQAAVNGLTARIGFSTDVSPNPYWDALLLEVATGTTGAGTVTVTSTAGASTVTTTYPDGGAAPPALTTWSATR